MKKAITLAFAIASSSSVFAVAPGGPDCGWGNMLFEGQSGLPAHISATLVDGTSGNATFGMTSGTNGCSTDGVLTYGGTPLFGLNHLLDEFSQDVAIGEGEALTAVTINAGIAKEDRTAFKALLNENFDQLFPTADVNAEQVYNNIIELMKADENFAQYVS